MQKRFFNIPILNSAEKIFWAIGRRAFLAILLFILFDIILGLILVYFYIIMPKSSALPFADHPVRFNSNVYQKVLNQQSANEQYLQALYEKASANPPEDNLQP